MIKNFLPIFGAIFFLFPTCLWAMNSDENNVSATLSVNKHIAIDHDTLLNTEIPGSRAFKLLEDTVKHGYLLTTVGKFVLEDLSNVKSYFGILKVFSSPLGEDIDRTGFVAVCTEFTLKKRENSLNVYKYLIFTFFSEKSVKNSSIPNKNPQFPPFLDRPYSFSLIQK